MNRVASETTSAVEGLSEKLRALGRRYSRAAVAEAMGEDYDLENVNPDDIVPGTCVRLHEYLEYQYGSEQVCLFGGTPVR